MAEKKHMAMASRLMKAKSGAFDKAGRALQKRTPFRKVHEDEVRPGAKPGMPTGVRNMRALQRSPEEMAARLRGMKRGSKIVGRMGGGK